MAEMCEQHHFDRGIGRESRMAAEIRPGVHRPDWAVVTKSAAREALIGRDRARAGPSEKWIGTLPASQDLAWQTVLQRVEQGESLHWNACVDARVL